MRTRNRHDGEGAGQPPARSRRAAGEVVAARDHDDDGTVDRADRWQQRLAVPVLVAALASVPAVFLTLFEGAPAAVGSVINTASGAVLIAEAVVLFVVAEHRLAWLRRNLWLVGLAAVMIPAVIFAVGPVQLLRLTRVVRAIGALRIIRVRRIVKAGSILRERMGLDATWQRIAGAAISLLVAAFVAIVLADPTSQSRQLLDSALGELGAVGVVAAGLVLAGATFVVYTARRGDDDAEHAGTDVGGESPGTEDASPGAENIGADTAGRESVEAQRDDSHRRRAEGTG